MSQLLSEYAVNLNFPPETKGNILLIDDLPENLKLLTELLSDLKYTVRSAINGTRAIKSARAKLPDIILLDIHMPEMDGYQVCQAFKLDPELCDIPILFISALDDTFDKLKAFQVGGVDYITKPFQMEEVVARLETHLTIQRQKKRLQDEIAKRKQTELILQEANRKLELLANLDGLTKIANRRRFDDYLNLEWNRHQREQNSLTLLFIDIDYFKRYNDTYGHQGGDDCLMRVAQAIAKVPQRPTDLVARYGGEEFAVILSNTNLDGGLKVAEAIQTQVLNLGIPHQSSDVSEYVTLSIGVASLVPTIEQDLETLIANADQALYVAKNQGRNRAIAYQMLAA